MMLLAMSSVLPSFNSINYGLPSLKSSLPSLSSSARHLSPSATWSNRHSGVSKGTRPRISSNSGGLVRNLGTLLPEQFLQSYDSSSELTYHSTSTVTPRLSPQPHSRLELSVESDSAVVWSMPTPPRSESGPTTRSPAVAGSYSLTTATGNSDAPATRPSMRFVYSKAICIFATLVADRGHTAPSITWVSRNTSNTAMMDNYMPRPVSSSLCQLSIVVSALKQSIV